MSAWFKRFGLHMAAAVGATGIFVAAAAAGASQTRHQTAAVVPVPSPPAGATGTPAAVVAPERSLAGTIVDVLPDGLDVQGVGGRTWRVSPAAGALIRLNGKTAPLEALRPGDSVAILGQAQPRQRAIYRFLAHAITARRK